MGRSGRRLQEHTVNLEVLLYTLIMPLCQAKVNYYEDYFSVKSLPKLFKEKMGSIKL